MEFYWHSADVNNRIFNDHPIQLYAFSQIEQFSIWSRNWFVHVPLPFWLDNSDSALANEKRIRCSSENLTDTFWCIVIWLFHCCIILQLDIRGWISLTKLRSNFGIWNKSDSFGGGVRIRSADANIIFARDSFLCGIYIIIKSDEYGGIFCFHFVSNCIISIWMKKYKRQTIRPWTVDSSTFLKYFNFNWDHFSWQSREWKYIHDSQSTMFKFRIFFIPEFKFLANQNVFTA